MHEGRKAGIALRRGDSPGFELGLGEAFDDAELHLCQGFSASVSRLAQIGWKGPPIGFGSMVVGTRCASVEGQVYYPCGVHERVRRALHHGPKGRASLGAGG